jgi:hypothetical protein
MADSSFRRSLRFLRPFYARARMLHSPREDLGTSRHKRFFSQPLGAGERSGLQTRTATTGNVSLRTRRKSGLRLLNLNRRFGRMITASATLDRFDV